MVFLDSLGRSPVPLPGARFFAWKFVARVAALNGDFKDLETRETREGRTGPFAWKVDEVDQHGAIRESQRSERELRERLDTYWARIDEQELDHHRDASQG
jgi:hypothetical protein